MDTVTYLQGLCLATTPAGTLLAALTSEESDDPSYMDSQWFVDFRDDLVLVQLLWPELLRPAPPRTVLRGNFQFLAHSPGDEARRVCYAFVGMAPRDLHTAMCWVIAAACRRQDWAPPPILEDAIEATIHRCHALIMIPSSITTRAAALLPRRLREERAYMLTAAFLRLAEGWDPKFPADPVTPADCWPATVLAWDLAATSPMCLRRSAHRLSTRVGLGPPGRDVLQYLMHITALAMTTP